MTSSRIRRPLIALLAALQLVVQPLASTAWCAFASAVGHECCCHDAAPEAPEVPSCCGHDATSTKVDERREGRENPPCHCAVAPPSVPGTVPEPVPAPSELQVRDVFAEIVFVPRVLPRPSERAPGVEGRAPGVPRPPRLLFQVFRL